MLKKLMIQSFAAVLACTLSLSAHAIADSPRAFDIPAGELITALETLAKQTDVELAFEPRQLEGVRTNGVKGLLSTQDAVRKLIDGTGLQLRTDKSTGAMMIAAPLSTVTPTSEGATSWRSEGLPLREGTREAGTVRLAQSEERAGDSQKNTKAREGSESQELPAPEEIGKAIPEVLVERSKSLNMDIKRSRDDVLPYVVFDRQRIEQSGAVNIEDFLKRRLTMNTQQATDSQSISIGGNRSRINLRGLGTTRTLILIDGRRTSNTNFAGSSVLQQDLNGIPLSAVERIEILPTTASGIYGGDATGGVINIILRRDYEGTEVRIGWDSAIDSADGTKRLELSSGHSLEGGKTSFMVNASWSDGNPLLQLDRDFVREYRRQSFVNANYNAAVVGMPLGYTTNIRSTSGNLVLDNGTALNSTFAFVPVGYVGAGGDGGNALATNAGNYNFDVSDSAQANGGREALLSNPRVESVHAAVRRQFSDSVQAFLEAGASNNEGRFSGSNVSASYTLPGAAPNNPFVQEIQVTVPVVGQEFEWRTTNTDRRFVGGVIGKLPWGWQAEADYVWSRTKSGFVAEGAIRSDAMTAVNNGIRNDPGFNPLRDTNVYRLDFSPYLTETISGPYETTTRDVTALLGGPVGRLPGGRPSLNVRLEHRDEGFDEARQGNVLGGGASFFFPSKSQSVNSAVVQVGVPLVSAQNKMAFAKELDLQLSARRDVYEVRGATGAIVSTNPLPVVRVDNKLHSTNPTMGMRWKPIEDVMVRVSYGTGFLPPNVSQLAPSFSVGTTASSSLFDPRRGNTPLGIINLQTSGNPNLEPEESESWSAGLILAPRRLPGLRLSIDFTKIDFSDRIATHPQGQQGVINDEALFPDRIRRGTPTAAEAAMGWAGPIQFVDNTLMNVSLGSVKAYDMQLDYSRETQKWGLFEFFALASWQPDNETQTKEGQPIVDNVGFRSGVLEYKGNAGVTWNRGGWTAGWLTNYYDSYLTYGALALPLTASQANGRANSILTQGSLRIPHQIYHDAFATYRFGRASAQTEVTLGVRNVFNTEPPREQQAYSSYGDPRLASYHLSIKQSF